MIKTILRFLWRRDSESAAFLVIELSVWLSLKDLRQLEDLFRAVAERIEYTKNRPMF